MSAMVARMKVVTPIIFLLFASVACAAGPALPDRALTPGVANPVLTKAVICAPGFTTKKYRHVTAAEKRAVYAEYHMATTKAPCACEVDHLISLEIGGSNDIRNLWPQPFEKSGILIGAHDKDKLENKLHAMVCAGQIDLLAAQKCISENWYECYQKYGTR
jgi:hypothetical protein